MDSFWKRESQLPLAVRPWYASEGYISRCVQAAQIGLGEKKKERGHQVGWVGKEMDQGGVKGEVNLVKIYYKKLSKISKDEKRNIIKSSIFLHTKEIMSFKNNLYTSK